MLAALIVLVAVVAGVGTLVVLMLGAIVSELKRIATPVEMGEPTISWVPTTNEAVRLIAEAAKQGKRRGIST